MSSADQHAMSANDVRILQSVLERMARRLFGESSLLYQRCLGLVSEVPQHAELQERQELWRAFVLVAKETIRNAAVDPSVPQALDRLLFVLADLGQAYCDLARNGSDTEDQSLCERFRAAYRGIREAVAQIDASLGLQMDFVNRPSYLPRVAGERALDWLCAELRQRPHRPTCV